MSFIRTVARLRLDQNSSADAAPAANGAGRSAVMILGSYGTACTATAIARDLLLTAAHCAQDGAEYKLVANAPGEDPVLQDILRIERDPQFDRKRLVGHLATADVALLKLAQPLPPKIPPVRMGGDNELVAVGDAFVVAGYGVTVRGDGRTGVAGTADDGDARHDVPFYGGRMRQLVTSSS